jgi:hypothetical protein
MVLFTTLSTKHALPWGYWKTIGSGLSALMKQLSLLAVAVYAAYLYWQWLTGEYLTHWEFRSSFVIISVTTSLRISLNN